MTDAIDQNHARQVFQKLLSAADEGDEERITELAEDAKRSGLQPAVATEVTSVTWEDSYPLVKVACSVNMGEFTVATWQEEWSGHWGGGGTGWWVEMLSSDAPDGMEDLLCVLGLESEPPDVPRSSEEVDEYERGDDED